jgi:uncharacterized protein
VVCRRPSSDNRLKKLLVKFARRLPGPVRDLLRSLEHTVLMSCEPRKREVSFSHDDVAGIMPFRKIVVLDDAIDTGATIQSVIDALRGAGYRGKIITVVFAWTNPKSRIKPDFWFKESVLVKFPWSREL